MIYEPWRESSLQGFFMALAVVLKERVLGFHIGLPMGVFLSAAFFNPTLMLPCFFVIADPY